MTAQVIAHPAAADLRSKIACAEKWAHDLYNRKCLAGEWNDELWDVYGGQDIAVEQADDAAADLRRELAALELQAETQAAATGTGR